MNAEEILHEMLLKEEDAFLNASEATDFIARFKERVNKECNQLDGKASGMVWRRRDGRIEEAFFLLVPRDSLSVPTINDYIHLCEIARCDDHQISGAQRVLDRFKEWQESNPIKTPDAEPGECL